MTWTEPKYCLSCKEPISMCQCAQTIRSTDDLVKSLKSKLSRSEELNRELVKAGKNLIDSHKRMIDVLKQVYDEPGSYEEWAQHLCEFKEVLKQVKENK